MKQSEEAVLFPEITVDNIIVKPWSFGMLFDISSDLEEILNKMENTDLLEKLNNTKGFIPYTLIARIFTIASPHVLRIISLTVGKPEEEIRLLSMETGMKIAMVIYNQNKQTILNSVKNVFSPSEIESEEEKSEGRE
jgi:hypothetical protein